MQPTLRFKMTLLMYLPAIVYCFSHLSRIACSPVDDEQCINGTQFDRIDALTPLQNGTMLLIKYPNYWILEPDQAPIISAGKSLRNVLVHDTMNAGRSAEIKQTFAVVNVGLKAVNDRCLPTNQIIIYRMTLQGDRLFNSSVIVLENDSARMFTDTQHFGFFEAAHSIDWKRPVSSISYWNEMIIIFQDDRFVSVRCEHGKWIQILSKPIREVFPGLATDIGNPNTVMVRDAELNNGLAPKSKQDTTLTEGSSSGLVFLFYKNIFYKCDATGNDLCEGPYELLAELLNVSDVCTVGCGGRTLRGLMVNMILLLLLLLAIVSLVYLISVLRSFKYQYLINSKQHPMPAADTQNYYKTIKFSSQYSILQSEQSPKTELDSNQNMTQ